MVCPGVMPTPSAMVSSMTIALSTTIPTPSAKPPKLKTLSDKPNNFIKMIATKVAKGMARTIMIVCRKEPKNSKTAIAASTVPINPELVTLAIELRMKTDSSKVGSNCISSGINPDCRSCSMRFFTPSTTSIVLASGCLVILTFTAGFPLRKTNTRCSSLPSMTSAKSRR